MAGPLEKDVVTLNDGTAIPAVGLGVFKVPAAATRQAVSAALPTGYRHIDTAAAHPNERETGRAVVESDVPRDQLYVVAKLANPDQGYDSTLTAFDAIGVAPAVNQTELHPRFPRSTEAWVPLGRGAPLNHPAISAVAEVRGRTPAQVLIRWHLQLGNIVIPKSVDPTRIASNFDVFDFEPSAEEMASISSLDDGTRLGPNPRTFSFTGR
ncbi:aldo/keto reductase [Mycobacterium shigaense]|uniref:Oxidoreductase n=1 Tax=Mycobacterium shigaense TaxID=722731 RepID=A0A1Z4EFN0_9MYCO|nr:aldo/keto reductase [Mycobacterium shigaense]MEA1124797.1 aldo/keto reductase [Mycobacterium shigaense]PRI16486.1 hypothetical protein B2J96_06875 [Mycobacterium shigaense]BAX91762.1 oxidoreductase [Mycobacterium shigaense]